MFLFWKDKVLGTYCLTPLKEKDIEEIEKIIPFLKKEMPSCISFKVRERDIKRYRGHQVELIQRLELLDAYHSKKTIYSFYFDWI